MIRLVLGASGFPIVLLILAGCAYYRAGKSNESLAQIFPAPEGAGVFLDPESGQKAWAEVLSWGGESAIRIRTPSREVFKEALFSWDGEHGGAIGAVRWSPDGRYLAYQWSSSGGHQPYHAPVRVFDLASGKSVELEDAIERQLRPAWFSVTADGPEIHWSADGRLHFYIVQGADGWSWQELAYDFAAKRLERSSGGGKGPVK